MPAFAVYRFSDRLELLDALVADDYRTLHAHFELLGRLTHPLGERDERELWPVLEWTGRVFEPVVRMR
jgi:hypothetical protein